MFPTSLYHFADGLPPDVLILDLGCGTGLRARELAGAGHRVVGVDCDEDAVATARGLADDAPRPSLAAADATALPFRDGLFDLVLCEDVLHWARGEDDFARMIAEAWRVTGRGGVFAVRGLVRDALPDAAPLGDGRFRLPSGATWYLPRRADFAAALRGAEVSWAEASGAPGEDRDPARAEAVFRKPA